MGFGDVTSPLIGGVTFFQVGVVCDAAKQQPLLQLSKLFLRFFFFFFNRGPTLVPGVTQKKGGG